MEEKQRRLRIREKMSYQPTNPRVLTVLVAAIVGYSPRGEECREKSYKKKCGGWKGGRKRQGRRQAEDRIEQWHQSVCLSVPLLLIL